MSAALAQKIEPVTGYVARRFGLPDLNDCAGWLVPRLSKSWPQLQQITIFGWFRGIIDSPEYLFVRTDNAVSLSQRINERLSPNPIVKEHFTFPKNQSHLDEAAFLYTEIKQWAFRLGASEVLLQHYYDEKEFPEEAAKRMTDCPKDMVRPAFGKLFAREILFAKIGTK